MIIILKKDSKSILEQKEIFNKLVNERKDKIELTEKINLDDLTYYCKDNSAPQKFDNFDNGVTLFDKIKNGKIMLKDKKKKKKKRFSSDLNEIRKRKS